MILNIFSIFDEQAKAYGTPFFQSHVGQALRTFSDLAKDSQSLVSRHAKDFSLYHIGEFSILDAKIVSFAEPRIISRATEFSKSPVSNLE